MLRTFIHMKQKTHLQAFTLIEVVVSFFLLSVALMALLKLDQTSIEQARALLWQAVALTELDNGLSLIALQDGSAWVSWQRHMTEVLPDGKINFAPPERLQITWQLPNTPTHSSVRYQGYNTGSR